MNASCPVFAQAVPHIAVISTCHVPSQAQRKASTITEEEYNTLKQQVKARCKAAKAALGGGGGSEEE